MATDDIRAAAERAGEWSDRLERTAGPVEAIQVLRQLWKDVDAMVDYILAAHPAADAEPDMRKIVEALGFDPTNHHNAAKCPYCTPKE